VGIDAKRDDVDRVFAPRDRELGSAHEDDTRVAGGHERLGKTVHDVVIGQRQDIDAALRRSRDNCRRREQAVGIRRMAMKVVAGHRRGISAAFRAGGSGQLERRA
jgi:hypothetical protein